MTKKDEQLEILGIGLDTFSIEAIRACLDENNLSYHISFINDVSELNEYSKKSAQAVFFYCNRQSQKVIQDIKKIHLEMPRAAITLLSPRSDHQQIVGAFRAGLFDFLSLPIDHQEVRTVIYRLKLYGAIQSGEWNPERAVLHVFSRPESFSSITDISSGLHQYLNLFFAIEKNIPFNANMTSVTSLQKKLGLSDHSSKRIKTFLRDETGLIFGLRFMKDRCYFLIKSGERKLSYIVARNVSEFSIKDILSDYLANVLRTSLSILSESKKRDQILLMSMTDEVTGVFNQRKLVEDLDLSIGRYQHERIGFSLLFVDIDYFKNVNDQFGHVIGSKILIDLAAVLRTQLRSSDLIYRYGGDEFIVLLPRTDVDVSKKIALRISSTVKAAEFNIGKEEMYRMSLSVGIAEFPTDAQSAKAIIEFADKMMYLSKKSGRGKVFHVTEVVA
jgi:diguanylate cyclase (GGDEF)-like protein